MYIRNNKRLIDIIIITIAVIVQELPISRTKYNNNVSYKNITRKSGMNRPHDSLLQVPRKIKNNKVIVVVWVEN